MARLLLFRNLFFSLWDSVVDGVVDMAAHKTRSVLQMVGIILGVGSVVATFGLIDGGRRQGQEFWEQTGGIKKMLVRDQDARELKQNAQQKKSKGLTYDDALAIKAQATTLELVEPTMERNELVKAPGFEKRLDVFGATPSLRAHVRLPPGRGALHHPGRPGAQLEGDRAGTRSAASRSSAAAPRLDSWSASARTATPSSA